MMTDLLPFRNDIPIFHTRESALVTTRVLQRDGDFPHEQHGHVPGVGGHCKTYHYSAPLAFFPALFRWFFQCFVPHSRPTRVLQRPLDSHVRESLSKLMSAAWNDRSGRTRAPHQRRGRRPSPSTPTASTLRLDYGSTTPPPLLFSRGYPREGRRYSTQRYGAYRVTQLAPCQTNPSLPPLPGTTKVVKLCHFRETAVASTSSPMAPGAERHVSEVHRTACFTIPASQTKEPRPAEGVG